MDVLWLAVVRFYKNCFKSKKINWEKYELTKSFLFVSENVHHIGN